MPASGALKAAARPPAAPAANRAWPCSLGSRKISATILPRLPPICTEGPLPPQYHAGTQGTDAAEELDRQHSPPPHRAQLVHRPLDLGNAGTTRFRGKGMSEEVTDKSQQGAEAKAKQTELPPGTVCQQGDTLFCQPVDTRFEQTAHQSGQGADQRRQQQNQQGHLVLPDNAGKRPPRRGIGFRGESLLRHLVTPTWKNHIVS